MYIGTSWFPVGTVAGTVTATEPPSASCRKTVRVVVGGTPLIVVSATNFYNNTLLFMTSDRRPP